MGRRSISTSAVVLSEGTYEHIKHRLTTALERLHSAGHLGDDAYDQALSRAPRSAHAGLDSGARGGDENHGTNEAERRRIAKKFF